MNARPIEAALLAAAQADALRLAGRAPQRPWAPAAPRRGRRALAMVAVATTAAALVAAASLYASQGDARGKVRHEALPSLSLLAFGTDDAASSALSPAP